MFENNPQISETSAVSLKKILRQQLKMFCIQKDEDEHANETTSRKGSHILENHICHNGAYQEFVSASRAQKEKEDMMISGHRRVSLCKYVHTSSGLCGTTCSSWKMDKEGEGGLPCSRVESATTKYFSCDVEQVT